MSKPHARSIVGLIGFIGTCTVALSFLGASSVRGGDREVTLNGPLRHLVYAGGAVRNRKLMGAVTHSVQGVPAEPVDSFVWDGNGSDPITGELVLEIDPIADTGLVLARWTDEHGEWTFMQTRFIHPEHPSGVRPGSSIQDVEPVMNEGVAHNVYLHGDTGAGTPVLPTVHALLAAWGPASVTLNGEPFVNPYEIPAPEWLAHLMVTEGVRGPDGSVRDRSGNIYDPATDGGNGEVDRSDLEVHLVFHDERFPRTANRPNLFSFFYHLTFEDVVIQLVEAGEPVVLSEELLTGPRPLGSKPGAAGRLK